MNSDNILFLNQYVKNRNNAKISFDYLMSLEWKFNASGNYQQKSWKFWPFAQSTFSPLNPMYLFMIDDLSRISHFPFLMVRDGFFTLMSFFQRFPKPVDMQTKLIIHKNLSKCLPSSWKNNIWYFDYYISPKTFAMNKPKRRKILLKGFVGQSISSLQYIESKIKEVRDILKRDNTIELTVLMPLVAEPFIDSLYENPSFRHYSFDVYKLIYELLGPEVTILSTFNISLFQNPKETTFIDINEKFKGLCDDYVNNCLVFNGTLPEVIIKEPMGNNFYSPLSMNHGVLIDDEHPEDFGMLQDDIKKSEQYIHSKKGNTDSYFYYLDNFVKYLPDFKWKGSIGSNSENQSE